MRTLQLTTADFLSWLGQNAEEAGSVRRKPANVDSGNITLAWPSDDPADRPIIAIPAIEMRRFIAYVMTYVGTYVPFTAFHRVIPLEVLDHLPKSFSGRSIDELRPFVGAILADAAVQTGVSGAKTQEITLQACYATQSCTVAQAWNLSYRSEVVQASLQRWGTIRNLLGTHPAKIPSVEVETFWLTVMAAFDKDPDSVVGADKSLVSFLKSAQSSLEKGISADTKFLLKIGISKDDLTAVEKASREERIKALDSAFNAIGKGSFGAAPISIALGYMIAQLSGGSFSYLPLAMRYAQAYPLVPLWFGLFSGMKQDSDVLTTGDCVGRRVLRKLQQQPTHNDSIFADLNFEEFCIYQSEGRLGRFRAERASAIEVELFPGVVAPFRSSRIPESQARSVSPPAAKPSPDLPWARMRHLITELSGLIPSDEPVKDSQVKSDLFGTPTSATVISAKKRKVTSRKKPLL